MPPIPDAPPVTMAPLSCTWLVERWTLPWPEIRVPHYCTGRVGTWELKRQFQPVLCGYFRGLQAAAENYVLTRDDRVWMLLSPVEPESLAPHVPFMRGHVVIAGLGMGIVAVLTRYSAAARKLPGSCEAITGCPSRRHQSIPPSNSLARNPSRASLCAPLVDALQPIPSQ